MPVFLSGLSYLLVIAAGVSVALQQVLNSNLRGELGSPWWAGFTSYFVGVLVMLVPALFLSGPKALVIGAQHSSWFSWTGGVFGAIFIAIGIFMVPKLGAATVLALVVVGQMVGSLAFDHFGLLGLPQQDASPLRLGGAALLILGVILIRA